MLTPEILAPVGSIESFYAAIRSGADAVYLAGKSFGARAYANNFSLEEIIELIKYAHVRDKKVYVTVNTIILESELREAVEFVGKLYLNDVDAIIIQDLGLASILFKKFPGLALHASTQMNIHNLEMVKTIKKLGFSRVILPRETSIDLIKKIKEEVDIEVEVFVHGSLCVSYSGNCYFSSLIGKRSGNRGRCAQPCRLEYSLSCSDIKNKYLLSTKDLCTLDKINELTSLGVDSFKIEGRMKRPEYVSLTSKVYKEALKNKNINLNKNIKELKLIYNREFTKGFIFNENNNDFTNVDSPNHIGVLIGKVVSTYKDKVNIKLFDELQFGDSVRLVGSKTDAVTINQMYVNNQLVKIAKANDIVTIRVHESMLEDSDVYLTTSKKQIDYLNEIFKDDNFKVDIDGKCYLKNNKLVLEITDGINEVIEESSNDVQVANNLLIDRIKEQLQKTSNTIFNFRKIEVIDNVFIPVKELNELRRKALMHLEEKRAIKYPCRTINKLPSIDNDALVLENNETLSVIVKVQNKAQLEVALNYDVKINVSDYELYKEYETNDKVFFSYPRISLDYNKYEINKEAVSCNISSLKNNTSSVYMNVSNSFDVKVLEELGAKTVGLSIELSFDDIKDLINGYTKKYKVNPSLEMMVYGYYELMIMKYCPIQKISGYKNKNCGMCIKNDYYLNDKKGYSFRLIRDEECNMRVLNSKKLHLIDYISDIINCGVKNILLDFTTESANETEEVINMYLKKINHNDSDNVILGVTNGHFLEGVK